jgi:hypothetical protein
MEQRKIPKKYQLAKLKVSHYENIDADGRMILKCAFIW